MKLLLDESLPHEFRLLLPCSVILLLAKTNKIDDVRHFASPLLIALRSIKASTFLKLQPY